jgi:hypothetical protein
MAELTEDGETSPERLQCGIATLKMLRKVEEVESEVSEPSDLDATKKAGLIASLSILSENCGAELPQTEEAIKQARTGDLGNRILDDLQTRLVEITEE